MRCTGFAIVLSFLLVLLPCYSETLSPDALVIITNRPPLLEPMANITANEGDLINLTPNASDPNGYDTLTFNYSAPFNSSGHWQTGEGDGGIYVITVSVTDGEFTNSTQLYAIVYPYCGDGNCDSLSESCLSCPIDCGTCPATRANSDSSAPRGGADGSYDQAYVQALLDEIEKLMDGKPANSTPQFESKQRSIDVRVEKGEFLGKKLAIENKYLDKALVIEALILGSINNSIVLDTRYLSIKPGQSTDLNMLFLGNMPIGEYDGELYLVSSKHYERIPITLKVIERLDVSPDVESVDADLDILTEEIVPGSKMKYKVTLRKTPMFTEEEDDVLLKQMIFILNEKTIDMLTGASIADISTSSVNDQNFIYFEDNLTLLENAERVFEVEIPKNFVTGDYILNLNIKFRDKNIPLSTKFAIQRSYSSNFLSENIAYFAVLMTGIISLLLFTLAKHTTSTASAAFGLMTAYQPKKAKDPLFIGMASGVKAFLDLNDLSSHIIISGAPSCGKTHAAQVIAEEVLGKKVPVLVFDHTSQWSGFLRNCSDDKMLGLYKRFSMKKEDVKYFPGTLNIVENPLEKFHFSKYSEGIHIFDIKKIIKDDFDMFVGTTVKDLIESDYDYSDDLRLLVVYDDAHRLLPKYGGAGTGLMMLEKAMRDLRKKGIGFMLISQDMQELIDNLHTDVGIKLQMRTSDSFDIERIKQAFEKDVQSKIMNLPTGTALVTSPEHFLVNLRPVLHSSKGFDNAELSRYYKTNEMLLDIKAQIGQLEGLKQDMFEIKIELDLALEQLNQGKVDMADIYIGSLGKKLKARWKSTHKSPKKLDKEFYSIKEIEAEIEKARYEQKNLTNKYQDKILALLEKVEKIKDNIEKGKRLNIEKLREAIAIYEKASKTRAIDDIKMAERLLDELIKDE